MIRKILLLTIILGFMVQGVNASYTHSTATSWELVVTSSDPYGSYCYDVPNFGPGAFYTSGSWTSNGGDAKVSLSKSEPSNTCDASYHAFISGAETDGSYDDRENGGTVTSIGVQAGYTATNTSSGRLLFYITPPNVAIGESCDGGGTFTYYSNGTYLGTDTNDGNYSFYIFDDEFYQIHFTDGNISEWHNFTASGDEEWNPTDTCNDADFNFTNLSYTSPVKQYLTSTVTVDINDTDGTISSAIARIDGSNYSMQFIGGEKWRYLFTGTNIIKNYYITNIYATDNDGGQDFESYNASYIHVESRTGGGGGGGGSYPSDPTIPPFLPCTLNCDDNNDGTCDRNCDTDDDYICDTNCEEGIETERPDDEDITRDILDDIFDGKIPDDFWTDNNLRIHPASLNSTAFYTGWDKPQNITYRFLTNKFIDSCDVVNGTCTIDQRFLVNFNTIIDGNTTGYRGTLTVSRTNETAIADIYINVINLCACKEITPWQLNISDEWAQKLVYFVRVKDGAIVCIRLLTLTILLIILLGIVWYDSNKR